MNIEYVNNLNMINNIGLGQIEYNTLPISTSLASCVSIMLYSEKLKKGALSHITGFNFQNRKYCHPNQVLEKYLEIIEIDKIHDPTFHVSGGCLNAPKVYINTLNELEKNGIEYKILNELNHNHRRILFHPKESKIKICEFPSLIKNCFTYDSSKN